jgi:hypothetical protein
MLQARDQIVVKLYGNHVCTASQKCLGKESEPWPDFKDELSCGWRTGLHDAIANIEIVQEVLAKALLGRMAVYAATARYLAILRAHAGTAVPMRHCA